MAEDVPSGCTEVEDAREKSPPPDPGERGRSGLLPEGRGGEAVGRSWPGASCDEAEVRAGERFTPPDPSA